MTSRLFWKFMQISYIYVIAIYRKCLAHTPKYFLYLRMISTAGKKVASLRRREKSFHA